MYVYKHPQTRALALQVEAAVSCSLNVHLAPVKLALAPQGVDQFHCSLEALIAAGACVRGSSPVQAQGSLGSQHCNWRYLLVQEYKLNNLLKTYEYPFK
jgi:hypothetical protein